MKKNKILKNIIILTTFFLLSITSLLLQRTLLGNNFFIETLLIIVALTCFVLVYILRDIYLEQPIEYINFSVQKKRAIKRFTKNSIPFSNLVKKCTMYSMIIVLLFASVMNLAVEGFLMNSALLGLVKLYPEIGWQNVNNEDGSNFYNGHKTYLDQTLSNSCFKMGYAKASIVPSDIGTKSYPMGGYFNLPQMRVTEVADGQFVRAICIDDNSGRGSAIFAVLDGSGLSNRDVREIRERLKEFAEINNIVSINISTTHAHSCIDTQGLGADLVSAVLKNHSINMYNLDTPVETGRDSCFMENLYEKSVETIKNSFFDMREGEIFYGETDVAEFIKDKRAPTVYDKMLSRIRFVPNDDTREIWMGNMGAHLTSLSRKTTKVSSDYPFYIEKIVNEQANADFIFFQGAQGAIAPKNNLEGVEILSDYDNLIAYGTALGTKLIQINNDTKIEPILNVFNREIYIPADNNILVLAAKAKLVNNRVVYLNKTKNKPAIATEIGYFELGGTLAISMVPGELFPEIAFGGAISKDMAVRKTDWTYDSIEDIADKKKLLVFGMTNDAIGYILPDNDYGSILIDGHYEEQVSVGSQAASTIVKEFGKLINKIRL